MTTTDPVRYYVLHDHGTKEGAHGHSTAQEHYGPPRDGLESPRALHEGVETVATWEEARATWGVAP